MKSSESGNEYNPFITENGNYIVYASFNDLIMQDLQTLSIMIKGISGVVENGIFYDMATKVFISQNNFTVKIMQGRKSLADADLFT